MVACPVCVQVVLLSATMPAEVLEVTKKFMRDPIRILVKKEELTLEGIKQFYINVEREVGSSPGSTLNEELIMGVLLSKAPCWNCRSRAARLSSCGCVSMGTPGKESKDTASQTRLGRTSFLMSSVLRLEILCYTTNCCLCVLADSLVDVQN